MFLRPGTGEMTINGLPFDRYFVTDAQRILARQPLVVTETASSFNVVAHVAAVA